MDRPGTIVAFGDYQLDPAQMALSKRGRRIFLHDRALRLLLYLAENRDRIVPKGEILEAVWPGTSVTESSITTALSEVRHALDDHVDEQRWVRTVKGEGYRFVGAVEVAVPHPGGRVRRMGIGAGVAGLLAILAGVWAVWPAHPSRPAPPTSLVVLPFDDLSPEGNQTYFAHGISEELTDSLSHVSELRVVGRASAEAVKARGLSISEIGELLGVGAVVEGCVRRADGHLRITVQVVAVADGFHIWSEQYDRPLGDVFAIQDEVALGVTNALEVRLLGRHTRRPPDPWAYELYLTGRHFSNRRTEDGLRRAISYFEEALGVDPEFAVAHAGLASARSMLFTWGHEDVDILKQAEASVDQALALDEVLPEGHAVLGHIRCMQWHWAACEAATRRAIQLRPGYASGHLWHAFGLIGLGRVEEARTEIELAASLEPLSPVIHWALAEVYRREENYEAAIHQYQRVRELQPTFPGVAPALAGAYLLAGMEPEFVETALDQDLPQEIVEALREVAREQGAYAMLNKAIDLQLESTGDPCSLGSDALIVTGRTEAAIVCLERWYERRSFDWLTHIDPLYDPIRADPRFQAILEGRNLAD